MNLNIIFDLDSTLADCDHRLHYITSDGRKGSPRQHPDPDWDAFFDACDKDEPIPETIALFHRIVDSTVERRDSFACDTTLSIWSARSSQCYTKTLAWLKEHMNLSRNGDPTIDEGLSLHRSTLYAYHRDDWLRIGRSMLIDFRMRLEGHYINDVALKQAWLRCAGDSRTSPNLVFEDRSRVVAMWRREGLLCCQVAPGDF